MKRGTDELPGKPGETERESRSPFTASELRMAITGLTRMAGRGDLRGLLGSIKGKLLNLLTHDDAPRKK